MRARGLRVRGQDKKQPEGPHGVEHSEERQHKCGHEGCEFAAKTRGNLKSHMATKHNAKSKEAAESTAMELDQEWMHCEALGCGKWRLLPPSIRAEDLPDVFQCHMNYWDKRETSCADPQVK